MLMWMQALDVFWADPKQWHNFSSMDLILLQYPAGYQKEKENKNEVEEESATPSKAKRKRKSQGSGKLGVYKGVRVFAFTFTFCSVQQKVTHSSLVRLLWVTHELRIPKHLIGHFVYSTTPLWIQNVFLFVRFHQDLTSQESEENKSRSVQAHQGAKSPHQEGWGK